MGLGANIVRGGLVIAAGVMLYAGAVSPLVSRFMQDKTPVESGYVSPRSLSIEGKKNGSGNIETYLQYKVGDEVVSLPCTKGPSGPLCGKVDYWWQSIGVPQREGLVVGEWPAISNDAKHGIMSSELQTMLETFYGTQKAPQQAQQQPYRTPVPSK